VDLAATVVEEGDEQALAVGLLGVPHGEDVVVIMGHRPGELVRLERQGAVTVPDRDRAVCGMLVTAGLGAPRVPRCRPPLVLSSLRRILLRGFRSLIAIRLHPAGPVDRLPP